MDAERPKLSPPVNSEFSKENILLSFRPDFLGTPCGLRTGRISIMSRRIHWLVSGFLLLPMLAWASGQEPALGQTISGKPAISVEEALQISERFIKEKQIDVSQQYIHSIQLLYSDQGKKRGPYWRIQYLGSPPRLGMEQALKIFMDGSVFHEFSGP
jgi:hypothetical protein